MVKSSKNIHFCRGNNKQKKGGRRLYFTIFFFSCTPRFPPFFSIGFGYNAFYDYFLLDVTSLFFFFSFASFYL